MQQAEFSLADWPFYWLTRAAGLYLQQMEKSLKQIGLDIPRWRVLMILSEHNPSSVSEIADHAIAKLPTMTRIVQRMEEDRLVSCSRRANDARVTEVTLTPAGAEAAQRAWAAAHEIFAHAFGEDGAMRVKRLNSELEALFRALGG